MLYNQTELSEMVCTRISHDLIGNIGALSGALELIKENDNSLDSDTLDIIATATHTLKARQKFFRLAFGLDNNIDMSNVLEICTDYLSTIGSRDAKFTLHTDGITPELSKILCLSVMTAAEVCIKSSTIHVSISKQNLKIGLTSEYKLAANKLATYQKIMQNQKPDENISQYIQLIYLRELIGEDVAMQLQYDENSMDIIIG